jgi:hypothetical protein
VNRDDDLPLQSQNEPVRAPVPGSAPSAPTRWIVLAAAAIIAASLAAWWWLSRTQPVAAPPAAATAPDASLASLRPKRQPIDLPPLDASDDVIRALVAGLSDNPVLARLLLTGGLARATTLAVVQIGSGRTPSLPFAVVRPSTRLGVLGTDAGRIDPQSYHRWDAVVMALVSVKPDDLAQLYVNVKPLIDQAYRDLGYQNDDFDAAIVRAIAVLRETPEPQADPVLLQRQGYFEFEDETLRRLRPVQKQLILLGPDNRRRVMGWLSELTKSLDLKLAPRGTL